MSPLSRGLFRGYEVKMGLRVFVFGAFLVNFIGLSGLQEVRACAWGLADLRRLLFGEKPLPHIVIGEIKGALDYIDAHPGSDQGSPEEVRSNRENLIKAHQQILDSLYELKKLEWNAILAQQVFSEFAHRILMNDAFLESLRFLVSNFKLKEEVWDLWDQDLVSIAKLIKKNLPNKTFEAGEARKVLELWGQQNTYWSLRIGVLHLRNQFGEEESAPYQKWMQFRKRAKKSTLIFYGAWKGFQKFPGIFESEEALESSVPSLQGSPQVSTGLVGSKESSGIKKPGSKRTPKQRLAFMSAAARKNAKTPAPSFFRPNDSPKR